MLTLELIKKVPAPWSTIKVKKVVSTALRVADFNKSGQLTVSLVSGADIRHLNKKYRFQDKVTDVLSFPLLTKDFQAWPGQPLELGDIVICYPQIVRQAKTFKRSVQYEFCLMLVHGTLHLLGYDHERSAKQEKVMTTLTNQALSLLGFKTD